MTTARGKVDELVRHSVLEDELSDVYSTSVLLPGECREERVTYQCAVAAFNERGEGMRSEPGLVVLSCTNSEGGILLIKVWSTISVRG